MLIFIMFALIVSYSSMLTFPNKQQTQSAAEADGNFIWFAGYKSQRVVRVHPLGTMNLWTKFASKKMLRYFIEEVKILTCWCGARAKIRRLPKSLGFILWEQWIWTKFGPNFLAHPGDTLNTKLCKRAWCMQLPLPWTLQNLVSFCEFTTEAVLFLLAADIMWYFRILMFVLLSLLFVCTAALSLVQWGFSG